MQKRTLILGAFVGGVCGAIYAAAAGLKNTLTSLSLLSLGCYAGFVVTFVSIGMLIAHTVAKNRSRAFYALLVALISATGFALFGFLGNLDGQTIVQGAITGLLGGALIGAASLVEFRTVVKAILIGGALGAVCGLLAAILRVSLVGTSPSIMMKIGLGDSLIVYAVFLTLIFALAGGYAGAAAIGMVVCTKPLREWVQS